MISLIEKYSFKENRRRYLNLKGFRSKRFAFKGPDVVQVDLTDKCNSGCCLCWNHSPYVKQIKNEFPELELRIVEKFLKEVSALGTQEVIFSGGGEPFLYPGIWEALEIAQASGLKVRVNTNFTLLGKDQVKRLQKISALASVSASIWAKDAGSYARIHNRPQEMFDKVRGNLLYFNQNKSPKILARMVSILFKDNFKDIYLLAQLASQTKCDEIEFGMPDIIPGLTDRFLLSDTDAQWIKNELNLWDANIKKRSIKIKIAYKDLLLKRLKDPGVSQGKYDEFAGKIPCYCGWNYARLRANGDLNTCLKSHRMPMGNMYQSDFISCWNGSSWQEFREKSLAFPKDKEFFKLIGNDDGDDAGCSRSCDNFLVNNSTNKIARFFISAPRHKSQ